MSLTKRTQALPGWAKDWLGAAVAAVEAVGAAEVAAGAGAADAVAAAAAGHGVSAASASLAFCGSG